MHHLLFFHNCHHHHLHHHLLLLNYHHHLLSSLSWFRLHVNPLIMIGLSPIWVLWIYPVHFVVHCIGGMSVSAGLPETIPGLANAA